MTHRDLLDRRLAQLLAQATERQLLRTIGLLELMLDTKTEQLELPAGDPHVPMFPPS